MSAFFIVGVQRSGTTLLQTMLERHPDILMEPRAMGFRLITCYKNAYTLRLHNIEVNKDAFYTWLIEQDFQGRMADLLDFENIKNYSTIRELINSSIQKKITENSKKIWGDKSPNLQHYIGDLSLIMPDVKIIHILRDGRANANSMHRRSRRNLKLSAQYWLEGNMQSMINQDIIGVQNYKIIRYENLLSNPEEELRSVCGFLGLEFYDSVLNLSDGNLSDEKRYVKSNLDTSKIDQWKTQLSKNQIRSIENIQGPLLESLGYDLLTPREQLNFKPLSLRKKIWYNQIDGLKELINPRKEGMRNREKIKMKTPFKNRLYNTIANFVKDVFSLDIFKALFSRFYFKKKYYNSKK